MKLVETLAAAERLLLGIRRDPASIVLLVSAPIVLVLIFGYVFGGAIEVPGREGAASYREFLIPGLLVTMAFNFLPAMVGAARDTDRGIIDRFRSMPISRAAVPAGQALATNVYALAGFVVLLLCGLAVGWRARNGIGPAVGALGLLLLFQFSMTWVGMFLGRLLGREEAAGQAGILVIPLSMVSNVFVPTGGMPAWLRTVADWSPISAVSSAVRSLFGNPTSPADGAWPLEHPVFAAVVWSVVILAVFLPLTVAYGTRWAR